LKILLQMPGRAIDEWRAALVDALPEAEVSLWPTADPIPREVPALVDYALVWRPPPELFERIRPAKAVFNLGAGVDALLAVPTLPREVPVLRLEDAGMAEQMAEYVTLAVLAVYRDLRSYDRDQREGRWRPRPRRPKQDFGVGIMGLGVLGRAIAIALSAFGFPLAGWSRSPKSLPGVACFAGPDRLAPFLARSRVVVCALPATGETRALLDRRTLALLPRGAHVVNVARGDIVVDGDLLALLDEGHLSGATLDVFGDEPLPAGHPFWHHPRIAMTPHVSAVTLVADSIAQVAAKIRALERGEKVTGVVDRRRGY